jgi:hypothetical protein
MLHVMRRLIHHFRSPKSDVVHDHNPSLRPVVRIRRVIIRFGRDRGRVYPRTEHPLSFRSLHVIRPFENTAKVAILFKARRNVSRVFRDPASASRPMEHHLGVSDKIAEGIVNPVCQNKKRESKVLPIVAELC